VIERTSDLDLPLDMMGENPGDISKHLVDSFLAGVMDAAEAQTSLDGHEMVTIIPHADPEKVHRILVNDIESVSHDKGMAKIHFKEHVKKAEVPLIVTLGALTTAYLVSRHKHKH